MAHRCPAGRQSDRRRDLDRSGSAPGGRGQ